MTGVCSGAGGRQGKDLGDCARNSHRCIKFESSKAFLETNSLTFLLSWERRLIDFQRGRSTCLRVPCKLLIRQGPRPLHFQTECIRYLLLSKELP